MPLPDGVDRAFITRRAALLGIVAGPAIVSLSDIARAEDDWNKIVDAARKEGHVVLYSAFVGISAHQDLKKDFQAKYGITVDILEARASEVRERIRIEQAAGRFTELGLGQGCHGVRITPCGYRYNFW